MLEVCRFGGRTRTEYVAEVGGSLGILSRDQIAAAGTTRIVWRVPAATARGRDYCAVPADPRGVAGAAKRTRRINQGRDQALDNTARLRRLNQV